MFEIDSMSQMCNAKSSGKQQSSVEAIKEMTGADEHFLTTNGTKSLDALFQYLN